MSGERERRRGILGVPTLPERGDATDEEPRPDHEEPGDDRTASELSAPMAPGAGDSFPDVTEPGADVWGGDTARASAATSGEELLEDDGYSTQFVDFDPADLWSADAVMTDEQACPPRDEVPPAGDTEAIPALTMRMPADTDTVRRPADTDTVRRPADTDTVRRHADADRDRFSGEEDHAAWGREPASDTLPPLEGAFFDGEAGAELAGGLFGAPTDPGERELAYATQRAFRSADATPIEELASGDVLEGSAPDVTEHELRPPSAPPLRAAPSFAQPFEPDEPSPGAPEEEGAEERWRARAAELEREAVGARATRRIALLLELGAIWRDRLHDSGEATQAFERALTLDPECAEAFAALEQIFERTSETERLIELLLDRSEHAERWEQFELLRRAATLYEEHGDAEKAIVVLEAAHALLPEDEGTAAEIRRLGGQAGHDAGTAESPKDPLELLRAQLEQTRADDERAEILEQLATLAQRRGEVQQAIAYLQQILELDPRREAAHGRLARLYEQQGDEQALADAIERHLDVAPPQRRLELCRRLGQLCEGPLADPVRARRVYERGREVEPTDRALIAAVIRLAEQEGDWPAVAAALRDQVRLATRPRDQAEVLYRLGRLHADQLADPDEAEHFFVDALAAKASHEPAFEALLEIYRRRADWGKVVKLLIDAEMDADSAALKTRLRYEAGVVTLHHLHEEEQAVKLFERTLAIDPDHGPAAGFLCDLYFKEQRFDALEPVLEVLLRKTSRDDVETYARLAYRMGRAAEALDKQQRARRYYREALELTPNDLKPLRQLAGIAYAQRDWGEAAQCYQRLLVEMNARARAESEFPENEVTVALSRIAEASRQRGDLDGAMKSLGQLLELRPGDREALERYAELQAQRGDHAGLIATKQRILDLTGDQEQRAQIEREIGDSWLEAGRPDEAAQAYWRALGPRPQSRTVLHKLLDLYSDAEQWPQTVDLCDRLAATEQDAPRRAKYHYTAGVVCRDQLKDPERAVSYFNKALDDDPQQLKTFEAIDELCTARRDWKRLEQCYGRMIQRLPADGQNELKTTLWHNLGEILRTRRRDFDTAAAAFEAAQRLDPGNDQRLEILAELYLSMGQEALPKALAAFHQLVRKAPHRAELYRTLGKLYMAGRQYDPAWCLCAVLSFLQQADGDERAFYQQHAALRQATARISDDLWWRQIAHPDQDRYVSAVFAVLAPIVASMTARPHNEFNLRRKNRRDLASDDHGVSRFFAYVTSLLNVAEADLHHRPDADVDLVMAHTNEAPSFVAGAHMLSGRNDKDMACTIGKQLTFLRPDNFLRNALPARTQLQLVLLAAIKMCDPSFGLPLGQDAAVQKMIAQIRKMRPHPATLEQLGPLVRRIKPEELDLVRWWRGCELTAERVGLIVSADPYAVAQRISADCSGNDALARERIAAMIAYAASEDYFAVRRELGLAIG